MSVNGYGSQHGATTLGDALLLIDALPATGCQSRDFRSAVESTARWLKKQPSEIPADPFILRRLFKTISPGGAGVSAQRFANVKSSVTHLVRRMGRAPAALHKQPLSAAWHALVDGIADKRDYFFMKRLGQFCSARGMEPDDVCDDVTATLVTYLEAELRIRDPHRAVRRTCMRWNGLVALISSWPQRVLAVPSRTRRYSPGWDRFHPDFHSDVQQYLARRVTVDPFDLSAPIRPLRPSSAATYRQNLRALLQRLCAIPPVIEDLAAILMTEDDIAHQIHRLAPRQELRHLHHLARMQARMQIGAADAAGQQLHQKPGVGSATVSTMIWPFPKTAARIVHPKAWPRILS